MTATCNFTNLGKEGNLYTATKSKETANFCLPPSSFSRATTDRGAALKLGGGCLVQNAPPSIAPGGRIRRRREGASGGDGEEAAVQPNAVSSTDDMPLTSGGRSTRGSGCWSWGSRGPGRGGRRRMFTASHVSAGGRRLEGRSELAKQKVKVALVFFFK